MTLAALDDLGDAFDATTAFLTPVDPRRWLKLALVVFFVGVPGSFPGSFQGSFGGTGARTPGDAPSLHSLPPDVVRFWVLVAVALVAVGVLLVLLYALVGSIMEFVLVESLRDRTVSIRESWHRRWRQGLRLFGFRLVLGLLVFGPMLAFGAFVLLTGFDPGRAAASPLLVAMVLLVPAYLLLVAVLAVVNGFTTVFVVPIMLLDDASLLDGWRRLWTSIRREPGEYAAYLLASVLLGVVGSTIVGIVTVVVALVLLLPFGVLFGLGFAMLALGLVPIAVPVLVLTGLVYGLLVLIVAALAAVPVVTYLRYYALLVLGDVDPALDLIPEQRDRIRSHDDGAGTPTE